ncbi:MAG: succinylglutamate desuccinylase/aspartoacylase family protein [Planctomycetes bacterium]|nr:succinylglutamate desuccinylase/aspartoacylase family protein [Planctomycetota bacterium]MCH9727034.1 succinylglutamate desuccinylase/aspartoacylase family protein [Planctomycetota bacterium]MCH9774977.1 succinylglutamate desuccinylase/aspartoacylase family protein [Planctomycetota bacterium]MCH9793354.1 succinylglutamate desuccinylase/aspartoacylase family protein [Planctomycetota bacterium]
MSQSPISTKIDFDKPGMQWGTLNIPFSYNLSGWAQLQIPIATIAQGEGPTVLLMAGNHGDEYPGQIAIMKLMKSLKTENISGRIIFIPAINIPAAKAATRLSPLDGKNLNRSFPGNADGTATDIMAHYLTTEIFPLVDVVIDLHTGGRGVYFYPCAHMHLVEDLEQRRRMALATRAYNTDFSFLYADIAGKGLLPVEAENMGKTVVTTEMGGGEVTSAPVHRLSQDGLNNVLIHLKVLAGEEKSRADLGLPPTRWIQALDAEDYIFAPESGLFESFVDVGTDVSQGQPLGALYFLERPDRDPTIIQANSDGIAIAHRAPTLTSQGDILFCLAHDVEEAVLKTFE